MSKTFIFFKGVKYGFRNFSHLVTDMVNFALLAVVYFIGIGIVAIIAKLIGKHFLDLKANGSSWVQRRLKKREIKDYYRMF